MPDDNQSRDNSGASLSDGESTPNSIGFWLVIAVIVSVVMVISDHGGAISSLLFLFGPIILIIIAVGKAADWAASRHAFDRPGDERQPLTKGTKQGDSPAPETRDSMQQDHPE